MEYKWKRLSGNQCECFEHFCNLYTAIKYEILEASHSSKKNIFEACAITHGFCYSKMIGV